VGYICPYCGEGLPEDEECPCQAAGDDLDEWPRRSAKREQDERRAARMRASGPVESFTVADIGERDGWICGICQDAGRLVDFAPDAPRALSPSIDHIVPVSSDGTHTKGNVRIAHLWCNVERNNGKPPPPEDMRAKLTRLLDGTPVPEEVHRSQSPSWKWPAAPRIEYVIALYIAAGRVVAEPRYGDPATRLANAARMLSADPDASIRRGLAWMQEASQRRARVDAWWRSSR
jgi:HNH endonuclease